jgi:hypothetical protein
LWKWKCRATESDWRGNSFVLQMKKLSKLYHYSLNPIWPSFVSNSLLTNYDAKDSWKIPVLDDWTASSVKIDTAQPFRCLIQDCGQGVLTTCSDTCESNIRRCWSPTSFPSFAFLLTTTYGTPWLLQSAGSQRTISVGSRPCDNN